MRAFSKLRTTVIAVLSAVLLVGVAALAVAAPPPGKGKAGAAQYGPAGKAYGKTKVTICHKGKTIKVAQPAVKAHLRHGDTLGPCP